MLSDFLPNNESPPCQLLGQRHTSQAHIFGIRHYSRGCGAAGEPPCSCGGELSTATIVRRLHATLSFTAVAHDDLRLMCLAQHAGY